MRPGASPLSRLAKALARLSHGDSADESARRRDRIEYRLRQSSFSLKDALEEAGGLGGRIAHPGRRSVRGVVPLRPRGPRPPPRRRRGSATARRSDPVRADPARRRSPPHRERARAHHHALGFHRRLRLFPWPVGGGERDAISGAEFDPQPARGGDPQTDRQGGRDHRAGTGRTTAQRLRRRARSASGAAALPDAAVGPGRARRPTPEARGISRARPTTTSGAWRTRCRATPTRSSPNAPERNWRSSRRSGRCRNSTGKAEPFAARFGSTSSWPKPGSASPTCAPCSTGSAPPNCSFLLPSLSASPTLAADERIDIGHEALLRRWKTIAGKAEPVDPKTGPPAAGLAGRGAKRRPALSYARVAARRRSRRRTGDPGRS